MTTKRTARMTGKAVANAKMISMRAPVTMDLSAEGEKKGPPTFEGIIYSGGQIPGWTLTPPFKEDYVVDLAGMTASRKPIANLRHDQEKIVGHVSEHTNDGRQLQAKGALSYASRYRDEVVKSAKGGFEWEASTEANLSKFQFLKPGESATVNHQTFTGPLWIARKSKFTGLAFCSEGADEGNKVRVAASAAGEPTMNEFEQWLVASGFDPETMTAQQTASMKAAFDAQKSATTTVTRSKLSELSAIEKQEAERESAITRMAHDAMKTHRDSPQMMDAIAEMGALAIKEKKSADAFELELLRGTRIQAGTFRPISRTEPDARVMEAALCRAVGLPNYEKQFPEQVLEAVQRDPSLRHFSLQQCLMRAACSNGYDGQPGERITDGNLKRVLRFALPDEDGPGRQMRATQFSNINLPGTFGNVANKELLAGFMEEDDSWREISRVANANDFKTVTAYRLTDSLEYELLPKGGEIKHGKLGEESYTRTLQTYAKMLGLDRQDIINDDLSAFDDLRTRLGRGAARKFNNVFWAAFMNNASFFTAGRGNYISGATTNLGTDGVGLTAGVTQFKKMLSSDNKRIGGQPSILLLPPELEFIGEQLKTGGDPAFQTVGNTNAFRGKYRPVVVPWLSDSNFTGYSTTAWYLLRDNAILAAMVASFLNGNQAPTVESTDADFNNLGILFRGHHDFSADQAEYLAGVKSKGAA